MNKTSTSLAAASVIVAFALALVAPVSAQTYGGPAPAYGAPGVSSTDTQVQSGTVTPGAPLPPGASVAPEGTVSPGLPNTGAGGNAAVNYAILLSAGLIAVGGTVYLARKFAI